MNTTDPTKKKKSLTEDPIKLAHKIANYITREGFVTYDQIMVRSEKHGIPEDITQAALGIVHKKRDIVIGTSKGIITYKPKPGEVEKEEPSYASWITLNYPWPSKNGIPSFIMPFPSIDYSYIFLRGEDLEKYKCEAKGRVYTGKKRMYSTSKKKPEGNKIPAKLANLSFHFS